MTEVIIAPNPASAAQLVAEIVITQLEAHPSTVLGIATGSSPMQAYLAVGDRAQARSLDLTGVRGFGLDEYVGLPSDHPAMYRNVVRREIEPAMRLLPDSIEMPDATLGTLADAGDRYEAKISKAGGIDLQILGIGTNGHIGFNEPGSSLSSRTRVKTLAEPTRLANRRFFGGHETVPIHCVTQGIGTILDARRVILIATGAAKARSIHLALEGPVSAANPASALQLHGNAIAVVDVAAAGDLRHREYYQFAWSNKPKWQRPHPGPVASIDS